MLSQAAKRLIVLCMCATLGLVVAQKVGPCDSAVDGQVVLTDPFTGCGSVEGRIRVCGSQILKDICDANWTIQDARVVCRSLGYSVIGANVSTRMQGVAPDRVRPMAPNCDGSEASISECPQVPRANSTGDTCDLIFYVKCYLDDSGDSCMPPTTTTPDTTSQTSSSPIPVPNDTMTPKVGTTQSSTTVDPASIVTGDMTRAADNSILNGNKKYYVIGGAAVGSLIVLVFITLILVVLVVSCRHTRHKTVSPTGSVETGQNNKPSPQEIDESPPQYNSDLNNSQLVIQKPPAEHQLNLQQPQHTGPIYEAVKSSPNDSPSSVNSQNSSKSSSASTGVEPVYSILDQSGVYAQIEPFIEAKERAQAASTEEDDTRYQPLNHSNSSFKKSKGRSQAYVPQAVNLTALALNDGTADEMDVKSPRELREHNSTSKVSGQTHLFNDVNINGRSYDQSNLYHVLDPSVDYSTDMLDVESQVSTDAIVNGIPANYTPPVSTRSRTIGGHNHSLSYSHEQQLNSSSGSNPMAATNHHHIRYATLPHSHTQSQSSQNSPYRTSPQTSNQSTPLSGSPLINHRINGSPTKVANGSSGSPSFVRRVSGGSSPRTTHRTSGSPKMNRLSGNSKISRMSTQSDDIELHGSHIPEDRNNMNTLV